MEQINGQVPQKQSNGALVGSIIIIIIIVIALLLLWKSNKQVGDVQENNLNSSVAEQAETPVNDAGGTDTVKEEIDGIDTELNNLDTEINANLE